MTQHARGFIFAIILCLGMFGPLFPTVNASGNAGEVRAKYISTTHTPSPPEHILCADSTPYRPHTQGLASWYGPGFHGKKMANGRIFDMGRLTVAHKTLRLGTEVCITNKRNGRSVRATVTDRGPYIEPRIIDLSKRVADELGITKQGVGHVEIALRLYPRKI